LLVGNTPHAWATRCPIRGKPFQDSSAAEKRKQQRFDTRPTAKKEVEQEKLLPDCLVHQFFVTKERLVLFSTGSIHNNAPLIFAPFLKLIMSSCITGNHQK